MALVIRHKRGEAIRIGDFLLKVGKSRFYQGRKQAFYELDSGSGYKPIGWLSLTNRHNITPDIDFQVNRIDGSSIRTCIFAPLTVRISREANGNSNPKGNR